LKPKKSRGKPGRLLSSGNEEGNSNKQLEPLKILKVVDQKARHARQMHELDRHNQQLLVESPYVRRKFMAKLKTTSPLAFRETQKFYRNYFSEKVIGRFNDELLEPNPRTRRIEINDKVKAYEVVLDVFKDASFFAYGILILPNDLKSGNPDLVWFVSMVWKGGHSRRLERKTSITMGLLLQNWQSVAMSLSRHRTSTFLKIDFVCFSSRQIQLGVLCFL
jgi:hypothetical protein